MCVRVEDVLLGEHADARHPRPGHPPGVDLTMAGEDAQQCRLAATVAAHDADAVAAEHAEGDLVEHLGGAEGQGGALDTDEVGHQSMLSPAGGH